VQRDWIYKLEQIFYLSSGDKVYIPNAASAIWLTNVSKYFNHVNRTYVRLPTESDSKLDVNVSPPALGKDALKIILHGRLYSEHKF
jgi:hypothetical protein